MLLSLAESKLCSVVLQSHVGSSLCISLQRLTASAEELSKDTGRACIAIQADVRQPKAVQEAVAKTIAKYGKIDFVICGTSPRNLAYAHARVEHTAESQHQVPPATF